ncbi:hypothetical protein BpHYR1_048692 [Brachionus plicatilis]|uniref:Uncharacterized protein n=1 Tax=Brachionus plicatilis TaxID=10195 RepID=A0A3M7S4M3_BRAPC|nr:hypothetical protein BpHYR1_048692 [Brachionus plicatilis]
MNSSKRAKIPIIPSYLNLSSYFIRRPIIIFQLVQGISGKYQLILEVLPAPPLKQIWKTLSGWINFPVKLRCQVIQPALVQPFFRVCKNFIIRVKTNNSRWIPGSPNSEWTNTKLYKRFNSLY